MSESEINTFIILISLSTSGAVTIIMMLLYNLISKFFSEEKEEVSKVPKKEQFVGVISYLFLPFFLEDLDED